MTDDRTWARRFVVVAALNSLIAAGWLVPLFVDPRISRAIAAGSVGTWGLVGFLLWIVVGCLGFVGFGTVHYLTPRIGGGPIRPALAWANLVLTEIGAFAATTLLGIAGYVGGTTLLELTSRGVPQAEATRQVHAAIAWIAEPVPWVAVFAALAGLGVLLGVVNHLMAFREAGI